MRVNAGGFVDGLRAGRALIERYPRESRRKLAARFCEVWQWRQANGALRDMVWRGFTAAGACGLDHVAAGQLCGP